MKRAWIIGAGGMLGSAIRRNLQRREIPIYRFREPFAWNDAHRIAEQFDAAAHLFLEGLGSNDEWDLYWVAGKGSMGSRDEELESETDMQRSLLLALERHMKVPGARGMIGFASSAGAIYAGSGETLITEASAEAPINSYARAKLAQERQFSEFADKHREVGLLIARITTLYGPGQDREKTQGLLSKMAGAAIRHLPIEVFVPLDTARDYLFVDDAAEGMVVCMEDTRRRGDKVHVKILANERSVTISQIIGTFNDVMKTRLRVIHTRSSISPHYLPKLSFESRSDLPLSDMASKHTLLEGISALVRCELSDYAGGKMS